MSSIKARQYIAYAVILLIAGVCVPLAYHIIRQDKVQQFYGERQFQQGNYDEAAAHFMQAAAFGDASPELLLRLGDAFMASQQFTNAARTFEALLEMDPEQFIALLKLAELNAMQGDFPGALQYLERARVIRPDSRSIQVMEARILAYSGKFDDAINQYYRLLEEKP